ncbi:MAG: hypothetical protein FWG03_07725 [Clostridiales bacterium]|nr:hypothetical protein [Clostridiales bacterium]
MKKFCVGIMAFIMVLGLSGCANGDKFDEAVFDTMDALKTQLGARLLYPETLPDGYEPMYTEIKGLHYTRPGTWDYDILLHDYIYNSDDVNEGLYSRIAEGLPVIVYIQIRSFEPRHRAGEMGLRTKSVEAGMYKDLIEESPGNVWDIGGVTVAHKAINASDGSIGGALFGRTVFDVREDLQETFDAYNGYLAYAAFYHEETLYTVEIQMDAPPWEPGEDMIGLCTGMLETVVFGML